MQGALPPTTTLHRQVEGVVPKTLHHEKRTKTCESLERSDAAGINKEAKSMSDRFDYSIHNAIVWTVRETVRTHDEAEPPYSFLDRRFHFGGSSTERKMPCKYGGQGGDGVSETRNDSDLDSDKLCCSSARDAYPSVRSTISLKFELQNIFYVTTETYRWLKSLLPKAVFQVNTSKSASFFVERKMQLQYAKRHHDVCTLNILVPLESFLHSIVPSMTLFRFSIPVIIKDRTLCMTMRCLFRPSLYSSSPFPRSSWLATTFFYREWICLLGLSLTSLVVSALDTSFLLPAYQNSPS